MNRREFFKKAGGLVAGVAAIPFIGLPKIPVHPKIPAFVENETFQNYSGYAAFDIKDSEVVRAADISWHKYIVDATLEQRTAIIAKNVKSNNALFEYL